MKPEGLKPLALAACLRRHSETGWGHRLTPSGAVLSVREPVFRPAPRRSARKPKGGN